VKPYQDKNPENDIKPVVTEHYSEDSVEGINLMKKKKKRTKGYLVASSGRRHTEQKWWDMVVEACRKKRNVKRR
jgi:hypothetical protein